MISEILERLLSFQTGEKGAVRCIPVFRAAGDDWHLWAPGTCTCSSPSYTGLTTQACAETITRLRTRPR